MNGEFQSPSTTEDLTRNPASHRGDSTGGKKDVKTGLSRGLSLAREGQRRTCATRSDDTGGSMASQANAIPAGGTPAYSIWKVILASAVGTMIEWYDFYIFGSLAVVLSPKFFPPGNDTFAYISYLATFAVGFMVRPFGALFFGRIGDIVGRKYAFLVTLSIMGGATALIGFLPTYATIGLLAPIILLAIRVLQGLALGGEYGGATVYVAEHVPDGKRGYYTSFIQITATLGLFASLLVILGTQQAMTPEHFKAWGWRIPFLASIILVTISLYIRLKMKESPIFSQIKASGMTSTQPLKEAFTKADNLKRVAISLFGATAGQGVIWYTGQFYVLLVFLQTILRINPKLANIIVAYALLFGMPFFTVFGALSDKIGRKWLMMAACFLAVVTYLPIYHAMQRAAGNNVQTLSSVRDKVTGAPKLTALTVDDSGKPVPAKEATNPNVPMLVLLVFIQVIYVCMIYGPIAAYLVEAFPAKIRYTSLSLPYHIGNGVFGGLVPLIGVYVCESTHNIYAGLYYPMIVASITFVVGSLFLKETHGHKIWDEVGGMK
jgi:MFS family permease